jgi:hypothetical protein
LLVAIAAASLGGPPIHAATQGAGWTFLVSGDARNCGDVIMPAIAETAKQHAAAFYWHLGDLRWTGNFDEDMVHQPARLAAPMSISAYLSAEWPDFIARQIGAFGSIPFIVGIGNHELIAPKTRDEFLLQFADWLDTPTLQKQRLADNPADHRLKTYYHWIQNGVDFIFLDNASNDMVDGPQLAWFNGVVQRAVANPAVTTIVAGMHKALPDGYNTHSMDESPVGITSGRAIYKALLNAQNVGNKKVYVLASHQHNYMDQAYDTPYWQQNGGVLPGWVVGTAGATRVPLPNPAPPGALTNVYGSLLGTVSSNGEIHFSYQQLREQDIPATVVASYGQEFVHWCWAENSTVPKDGAPPAGR